MAFKKFASVFWSTLAINGACDSITRCHAIAGTTARCALYMSALKIVCKRKISRRLRKNRHITILSLFGEVTFEVFPSNVIRVAQRYRWTIYCGITAWWNYRQTKCRRYYRYHLYL